MGNNEFTTELIKAQEGYVLAAATDQANDYDNYDETIERLESRGYLEGFVNAGIMLGLITEFDWERVDRLIVAKVQELCKHERTRTLPINHETSWRICNVCDYRETIN